VKARPKTGRPKVSGRVPGVRVPASPKTIVANRTRNLKHGRYSKLYVGPREIVEARIDRLRKLDPAAPDIYRAIEDAQEGRGLDGVDAVQRVALLEGELVRRRMVDDVRSRGVVLEESLFDKDGRAVGARVRANPLLEPLAKAQEAVGATADQMRLTKKSRGEGARDDATAAFLARDADLRAGLEARRAQLREAAITVEAETEGKR
jgi:hypothetical protein